MWTLGLAGRNKPASLNSSGAIRTKAEISKKSCSNVIQIVIYCQKKPHILSTWHFFVTHLIGTENGPVWARKSMWPTRSSFSCKEKQPTFRMFSCAHSIIPLIRCISPFRTNMKFCCNRVSNIAFFQSRIPPLFLAQSRIPSHSERLSRSRPIKGAMLRVTSVTCDFVFLSRIPPSILTSILHSDG